MIDCTCYCPSEHTCPRVSAQRPPCSSISINMTLVNLATHVVHVRAPHTPHGLRQGERSTVHEESERGIPRRFKMSKMSRMSPKSSPDQVLMLLLGMMYSHPHSHLHSQVFSHCTTPSKSRSTGRLWSSQRCYGGLFTPGLHTNNLCHVST